MPIERHIDQGKRLMTTKLYGKVTDAAIFAYQNENSLIPEISSYDEFVEVDPSAEIEFVSSERVTELAVVASSLSSPETPTKLAIFASTDLHFGLARMYQAKREYVKKGTITVRVFRDRNEALQWLG